MSNTSRKSVVITGGAGFVGTALVRRLVAHGYAVHVFVRTPRSLYRLVDLRHDITVYENVLSSQTKVLKTLKKIRPYAVCHLATYGAYPTQQDPEQTIDINVVSTLYLLESLRQVPCERVLVAGSSSEYGKKNKQMTESDILEPNNFYAAAKAMQTHLTQVFAKQYAVSACILRLFNVYGPAEEEGRLVRNVIEKALRNEDILLATGKEARDFIHVDDVAAAFEYFLTDTHTDGGVFNIGTGKQTTIEELAHLVAALTGSSSRIILNAYKGRPWDSTTWKADMSKTFSQTTWKPTYDLRSGLKQTIDWYKHK